MKLEVGMYVRTKKGIAKVKSMCVEPNQYIVYTDKDITFEYYLNNNGEWVAGYCNRYSSNIIDLIEVGDIVDYEYPTGLGMCYVEKVAVTEHLLDVFQNGENNHEYKIKSIVTKEQFESMSYKVQ